MEPATHYSLFISMRNGDEAAFERIYSLTLPFVRKTVNTYAAAKLWWVKDPYEIECFREEAVNDVYVELYKSRSSLKDAEALYGWLKTVAVRICCDKTTKIRGDIFSYEDELIDKVASVEITRDPEDSFDLLVGNSLGYDHYWALRLYALEGLSYDEIGKLMNVPTGTVKSRINTARKILAA